MTQRFKAVNPARKEFITTAGGSTARGTIMGNQNSRLAYLLLDGPTDGTVLSNNIPLEELPTDAVESKKEKIRKRVEEQGESLSDTSYYDDEAGWLENQLSRVVAAGLPISEVYEYAGRWAGDPVHLVGDYAESGLYDESRADILIELPNGDKHLLENGGTREAVEVQQKLNGDDRIEYLNEDATSGDRILLRGIESPTGERVVVELIEYQESDWTDITDGVKDELRTRFEKNTYPTSADTPAPA